MPMLAAVPIEPRHTVPVESLAVESGRNPLETFRPSALIIPPSASAIYFGSTSATLHPVEPQPIEMKRSLSDIIAGIRSARGTQVSPAVPSAEPPSPSADKEAWYGVVSSPSPQHKRTFCPCGAAQCKKCALGKQYHE